MDTNVLYSALRSRLGASYEVLRRLHAGEWTLLLSNTTVSEYKEILDRHRAELTLSATQIDALLDDLCLIAERHSPPLPASPLLPDPDDEAFAQLALDAGADALITHNLAHFQPARLHGIAVVTPGQFLAIVRSHP